MREAVRKIRRPSGSCCVQGLRCFPTPGLHPTPTPPPQTPLVLPPPRRGATTHPTAYGIETFTDMMDIRSILPLEDAEEEEEAVERGEPEAGLTSTAGGGLQASRQALRTLAPRTAAFLKKFRALNEALVTVIEDYNMVSFTAVSCRDVPSLQRLVAKCDKSVGFVALARKPPSQMMGGGGVTEEKEEEGEEEEEEEEKNVADK